MEKAIEKLKEQLTPLTLQVDPPDATVLLDGKELDDPSDLTHYLDPGEHTVMVQMQGYETQKQGFVAKRGEPVHIDLKLQQVAEETDDPGETTDGGDGEAEGQGTGETEADPGTEDPGQAPGHQGASTEPRVPWGAAVGTGTLAVVSGVVAIILGAVNANHHDDYKDLRNDIRDGTYTGDDPAGDIKKAEDKGHSLNAGVGVTVGLAAAAAAATAVLVPLSIPKKKVEVQATGTSISVSVTF